MKKTVFFIILILMIAALSDCVGDSKLADEKLKMQDWLKEKYGKEFVVDSIEYYTQYLGAPKQIKGEVYPVDDKELVFDITKFADERMWKLGSESVLYNERYQRLVWEKDAQSKITSLVNQNCYSVKILADPEEVDKKIYKKTIDLNEAKKLFAGKISMKINCALFDDSTGRENLLKKVFSIINVYKDMEYKEISLRVVIFKKEYEAKVSKEFNKYMNNADPDYLKEKKSGNIKVEYKIKNINLVNSIEEIKNYVENN